MVASYGACTNAPLTQQRAQRKTEWRLNLTSPWHSKCALSIEGHIFSVGACVEAGVSCPTVLWHPHLIRHLFLWVKRRSVECSFPECWGIFSRSIPAACKSLINSDHDSSLWVMWAVLPCLLLIRVWNPRGLVSCSEILGGEVHTVHSQTTHRAGNRLVQAVFP